MLGFAPIAGAALADPIPIKSVSVAVTGSAGSSAVGTVTPIPTINVPSTGTSANSGDPPHPGGLHLWVTFRSAPQNQGHREGLLQVDQWG